MKKELEYALKTFQNAYGSLKEASEIAKDELDKDGTIQRFEFTFELLWKTLKIFLEDEGIICKTPKECLKEAFRVGWIKDAEGFLDMLEDRNKTSHIYDKTTSETIFQRIKDLYINYIGELIENLAIRSKA